MQTHPDLPTSYPEVGDVVVFHDEYGRPANALITCVHGSFESAVQNKDISCVNLVMVHLDPKRTDQYGRQTDHRSSCVHKTRQGASGNYWRWPTETLNSIAQRQE